MDLRARGRRGTAQKTAIGNLPTADAIDISGLNLPKGNLEALTSVDHEGWKKEVEDVASSYTKFGSRLPKGLLEQLEQLRQRLAKDAS